MKIAIIGYGRMGKEIEKIAIQRGHDIVVKIDETNPEAFDKLEPGTADVAIEFSQPDSARTNILKCFSACIPVVSGTTGWTESLNQIQQICNEQNKSFLYASNFSLGVNIFFSLNQYLSQLIDKFPDYKVSIDETHHLKKLDSPSGTAISLANDCIKNIGRLHKWEESTAIESGILNINANREKNIFGIHSVNYESGFDKISIKHSAKSRQGFAMGAIIAAEFLKDKKGVYSMKDVLNL